MGTALTDQGQRGDSTDRSGSAWGQHRQIRVSVGTAPTDQGQRGDSTDSSGSAWRQHRQFRVSVETALTVQGQCGDSTDSSGSAWRQHRQFRVSVETALTVQGTDVIAALTSTRVWERSVVSGREMDSAECRHPCYTGCLSLVPSSSCCCVCSASHTAKSAPSNTFTGTKSWQCNSSDVELPP